MQMPEVYWQIKWNATLRGEYLVQLYENITTNIGGPQRVLLKYFSFSTIYLDIYLTNLPIHHERNSVFTNL